MSVKIHLNTEMISPRKKNNAYTTKPIIATTEPITLDVTRISGAEVCFLVIDVSLCLFTVISLLLFSILSSTDWFTSLQMQIHDVVFIAVCVTSLVVGVVIIEGVMVVVVVVIVLLIDVVVGVVVVKCVVVVVGVVVEDNVVVGITVVVLVVIAVGAVVVMGVVVVVVVLDVGVVVVDVIHTSVLVI